MLNRRLMLSQMASAAAAAVTLSSSAAPSSLRSSAREIGPAPARRAARTGQLRESINLADVMSPQQLRDARAGVSRDDTSLFAEALAAAARVEVPAGIYRVSALAIPDGRRIVGAGADTVLKPVTGTKDGAILNVQRTVDVGIEGMAFDGDGSVLAAAIFTEVQRLTMKGLSFRGAPRYNVVIDGCVDADVSQLQFADTGGVSHAALALVDWTRPGHRNRVSDVRGNRVTGRLIGLFSQADSLVERVDHRNVYRGEAVYFLNCLRCKMDQIAHIGGGAKVLGLVNPGNDGCAIDGGSVGCSATNGLTTHNSGHGLSINGTKGFEGSSHNIVRNWTSKFCDEGGVVVTDQGVAGSSPSHNRISDCFVENPGERVTESAFSCFGGYDNQFINCHARDTRPVKRMTVGYEEGHGVNGADRNIWRGSVGKGETLRSPIVRIGRNSIATQTP